MQHSSTLLQRRRVPQKMADRRRTFSPKYKPLVEEEEPEDSDGGSDQERGPFLRSKGSLGSSQGQFDERVVILSDHNGQEKSNGDADSGISLSEVEQPNGGKVSVVNADQSESLVALIVQIIIPFFFAGFGMMAAGLLLDAVQHWPVYVDINEIFILVPALLGLKGNLEMTLASRLSTAANVGQLSTWSSRWSLSWGNLSLIQAQALVVATLATVFSIVLGEDLTTFHQLLLGASAMGAASIASAVLGIIMIGVIILSYFCRINPDNVATPIAASLGDLVTLGLLSLLAQGFYNAGKQVDLVSMPLEGDIVTEVIEVNGTNVTTETIYTATTMVTNTTISPASIIASTSTMLVFLLVLIPVMILLAYRNQATRSVLFYGWVPVISAMVISSGGGWVLAKAVNRWEGIAVYSPIINGVGGNLVAVQASRISTSLHQASTPGHPVPSPTHTYHGPHRSFCYGNVHARTARVLVFIAIPGSLIFLFVIDVLRAGHTTQSPLFYGTYLICALLQVVILLLVADWMVHLFWRWGWDPDNIVIPFLTALGDLLGTGLLSIGFLIMWHMGDRDEDVGE